MREEEIKIYGYLSPFGNVTDINRLKSYDEYSARFIANTEAAIQRVKEYRKELFNHTQYLASAPYTLELKLLRERRFRNSNVYYYITLSKVYDGIGNHDIISESYNGTKRSTAVKRFEELKKQYPGAEAIKDIEKRSWEK